MQVRIVHLPQSPRLIQFGEGDSHPVVGQIQKILSEYGLYRGEAHGSYDAGTVEAVSRFQESRGLAVTGNIDLITYCHLHKAISHDIIPVARAYPSFLPRSNILINKTNRQLTLFSGNAPFRQYPVAIGKPSTPTPEGNFVVASKIINPGPPLSQAGILGTRWLGLNYYTYGIHGTNAPWAIGQMVSHGCIRMHNANVEELFALVNTGTPVFIRN
jgi:lipoprotein-anchoring transpeptidase ErfK/SrfK